MTDNYDAIDDILDSIEDGKSEVSPAGQRLVDQAKSEPELFAEPQTANQNVDANGNLWNASVHTNPPTKTAKGLWALKRGRKSGEPVQPVQNPVVVDDNYKLQCNQSARLVSSQFFVISEAIFGSEWKPTDQERSDIVNAWEAYFIESGIIRVPAWLALSIVMGSYSVPRMFMPETRERIAAIRSKFTKSKTVKTEPLTVPKQPGENFPKNDSL